MAQSEVTERPKQRAFDRPERARTSDLIDTEVKDLVAREPITGAPSMTIAEAARIMRDNKVSSLPVLEENRLVGIITVRDLAGRVLAEEVSPQSPVAAVMTADPATLDSAARGSDLLRLMLERGISHVPVLDNGRLVGMVTTTDVARIQALSTDLLTHDIAVAESVADMVAVTKALPDLLVRLVEGHQPHATVTQRITDVADAVTRRLLALAEAEFGPAPVPYVWAACGSQGRREQTGVTDQDNGIIIDDAMAPEHDEYFSRLATFVSDGLNACGYVYCPGDMMATNPRWRQPVRVWRGYFDRWIHKPNPKAQMLASVMFDLRPIAGDSALFTELQHDTLRRAHGNSIFVAHMITNSLTHTPPLTMLRGISTPRSGEHKGTIDLKHGGVIPVVDLGRLYALRGRLAPVNTRERLLEAEQRGVISSDGGRDLVAAYDVIATIRLEHQARQIAAGEQISNYLDPKDLSQFEREHLREAFLVVRTMQSAIGQGTSMLR
ncbi:MAG TPA: CBS domain-containing protein [Intrasporangiaceae bacterium]|nr:CBS domain-containing protein [Intrasporangiaceae bacterium]